MGRHEQPRLSVNISDEAFEFIAGKMDSDGISATQVLARALTYYKIAENGQAAGGGMSVDDGESVRQIIV